MSGERGVLKEAPDAARRRGVFHTGSKGRFKVENWGDSDALEGVRNYLLIWTVIVLARRESGPDVST